MEKNLKKHPDFFADILRQLGTGHLAIGGGGFWEMIVPSKWSSGEWDNYMKTRLAPCNSAWPSLGPLAVAARRERLP